MGGMQSGTNSLGDALWMHERQRQKGQRESARYESQAVGQNTHDRRKLLKRTRSLAVISEDLSRVSSSDTSTDSCNFHFGDPDFAPRRPQLIPRAKLIDRNSLKTRLSKSQQHLFDPHHDRVHDDRSYHTRSTCDLHTQPLSYFRESPCSRVESRVDPDRLNILDWPRTPRKYRSHQDLDSVSGLIDIVEDNWPLEDTRCVQVKRKRKEHRSLDSILLEDEDELEYFDVLNLLPLSNVRLELNESDSREYPPNNHLGGDPGKLRALPITSNVVVSEICEEESELRHTPRILQVSEFSDENPDNSLHLGSNVTDEEKCKRHSISDDVDGPVGKSSPEAEEQWPSLICQSSSGVWEEADSSAELEKIVNQSPEPLEEAEQPLSLSSLEEDPVPDGSHDADVVIVVQEEVPEKLKEIESYKSIWTTDMSRRPQVLKVVDNDTTRRRNRGVVEIDVVARDFPEPKDQNLELESEKITCTTETKVHVEIQSVQAECQERKNDGSIESTREFFERKSLGEEMTKNQQNEGRFERMVKETSSIIGKACSAVRGSLGFEARSESSDLGLGSDCGSDTARRRSIDDINEEKKSSDEDTDNYLKPGKPNLTRSHSCLNSIECQDTDGPEFDHIRYKIVKSRLFGKNIFSNVPNKSEAGYEGLLQYLREYSFQELLLDNNVVIIEPVRAEPVAIKSPPRQHKGKSTCRVAGGVQKKVINDESRPKDDNKVSSALPKSPKQSSLRKHFFYHPIRVNRELIDEELPDPDTVKNVRRIFENTLQPAATFDDNNSKGKKSISMKNLSSIGENDDCDDGNFQASRSRCSSRAKDLTRLFEGLDKSTSSTSVQTGKEDLPRSESKTRTIAQSFEARENTSPSDSSCGTRDKATHYRQNPRPRRQQSNWDAGSVSSGVSSDYPDTDPGIQFTSSEDEETECLSERRSERVSSHFVSQDVLKKIRECGTSVTYYGGKIVNTCNGPLIAPISCSKAKKMDENFLDDYVKFRLVKSNSCDSRLELTGRVIEQKSRLEGRDATDAKAKSNLQTCPIAETPSIEIAALDSANFYQADELADEESKNIRELPVVIGLEPKKDENRQASVFKADFKLGKIDDQPRGNIVNRFGSALTRWQFNETSWSKKQVDFGKMEFEEFEVLEDSLNATES